MLVAVIQTELTSAHFCFNVPQMLMNVLAMYTLATVQPRVSTLLDPTNVPVTVLRQKMEKLATWHQVSSFCLIASPPTVMTVFRNYYLLECTFEIERVLDKTILARMS